MLYSIPIIRTEQSPTLFGHINTQACGGQEVQWKEQGIENPRVGGSIPPPGISLQQISLRKPERTGVVLDWDHFWDRFA